MIKGLIDQFYLDKSKEEDKERDYFYISESGNCPRAIYFAFKKYPKKPLEARTLRTFDHGDYVHMRIMAVLFSLGLIRASEIGIPQKEIFHGRADAIISIENELYVIEIKSINKYGFNTLNQPKDEHLKQLQLYLHYFNIKRGILIYECKDTQELKEFNINYNKTLVKKLLEKFNELKKKIEKNIIPKIPQDIEDWKCDYCSYANSCKEVKLS